MSIYAQVVEDLEDLFYDIHGFCELHDVNGNEILAIVHACGLTPRAGLLDMGTFGADAVCIVRREDYPDLPEVDSVFFLDEIEYRVSSATLLAKFCYKIALRRVVG